MKRWLIRLTAAALIAVAIAIAAAWIGAPLSAETTLPMTVTPGLCAGAVLGLRHRPDEQIRPELQVLLP